MSPKISIVVPTRNQGQFIEQTLASIVGQQWPNLELIVIDGGSTDRTHQVVERYRAHIAHFISEPDSGQAEAINKGFGLATGDILAWLNSDDYYLPLALARAAAALPDPLKPHLAYGGCLALWEDGSRALPWPAPPWNLDHLRTRALLYQPSTFWTRALWEAAGEVDPQWHYVLDWEWFLRAAAAGTFTAIPELLSVYRFHPAHKSSSGNTRRAEEIVAIIEQHAGPEWSAAYRDVAAHMDTLPTSLDWLKRHGLWRLRKLVHRALYAKHGGKVKVALSQLRTV